jgi:peptide/nickel transport system substrate-binding protein
MTGKKSRWTGILLAVLFAVALLAVASCSPATAPADDQGPINVRLAIARDEGSLNPYTYVSGYPGHNLLLLIYDTLFQLDEQNVPQPWLVKSYQSDADGLVWSFTLREGVTWHDGEPLTADDVKFSYEYYREHKHARWTKAVAAVESIEVQDELSFTVKLSAPVPAFLMNPLADVPIIPAHIWQDVTDPDNFTDNTGSGPYRVVSHEPDKTYKLEANTEYFQGKPAVDEIDIVIIEDQTATFTALRVGDIDIAARSLPPELVEEFSGSPDVEVVTGPGFASTLLQINNEREPFDDPRVRLAIARAIDLDDLVETVLLGYGTAGNPGYVHPALPGYKTGLKHITDLAQARSLLEEADFFEAFGDKEFALLVDSNNPLRIRAAEIIAGRLKDIGMAVRVKALDSTTVNDLVWPEFDVTKGRDYDLAMRGWSAPVMLDPARLGALFHSDLTTRGTLNIGAYASGHVDAIVEELAVTVDPDRQAALLSDLQEAVAETVPFVTLFYPDGIYAYRPETYDGWVFQNGQGILNKLSFVPIP